MTLSADPVHEFLKQFEANSNSPDVAATVVQFADVFLAAGPDGATSIRASDFSNAIRKRKELFSRAGCRRTTLTSSRAEQLDARYTLVRTDWQIEFAPSGDEASQIDVSSTVILDLAGDEPKAVFYLAHQDIFKMLKERRLLPI